MKEDILTKEESVLWQRLVEKHSEFTLVIGEFFSTQTNRTKMLRYALLHGDIATALYVARNMKTEELVPLFEKFLFLASGSRGDVGAIRGIILSLPRDWVLSNIEKVAEPLLHGDYADESYRRLLELYIELDKDLALKLAQRAAAHQDKEIQEAGQDFLEILQDPSDDI